MLRKEDFFVTAHVINSKMVMNENVEVCMTYLPYMGDVLDGISR